MSRSAGSVKLGSVLLGFTVAAITWSCNGEEDEAPRDAVGGSSAESGTGGDAAGAPDGSGGTAGSADVGPSLAEVCAKTCLDQAELSCVFPDCASFCEAVGDPAEFTQYPAEYLEMLRCQAENLGPSDYECIDMGPLMGNIIWSAPRADTVCEPAICAWTCPDASFGHYTVYLRCGCG